MDAPLGGPLPVNFSNTYVPNLEINKVKSLNQNQKLSSKYNFNVSIFPKWNMIKLKRLFTETQVGCLYIGRPKFLNVTKGMK